MKTCTDLFSDSSRPTSRREWFSSPTVFALLLSLIFFAIVSLARANALTFPLPNEDDARFFFPARNLALYGTLRIPVLNAPEGLFWMPHGFYVWLALFLRIFGPTMNVARTVCQLTTGAASVLLVILYSRLCGSRGFALLCGALLVSPGVIFAANILRMESLMLLLFATGLLLHSYERRLAAAAIFFLGVVVHPALLLGATLYAVGIFWADVMLPLYSRSGSAPELVEPAGSMDIRRMSVKSRTITIVIVAAVAGAIALEGAYVLHHLPTFHQHMAYQIARKASRSPIHMLVTKRGLFLIFELVFTSAVMGVLYRHPHAWRIFIRELLPVFLLALGLSAYATFGEEIPYNVYSYAVIPATFSCLTYRQLLLPRTEEVRANVVGLRASWAGGVAGRNQ
jgi:hypothetical protein